MTDTTELTNTPMQHKHLRIADVIAKTAHVTLKDTLRVIAALDAVAYMYEQSPDDLLEDMNYDARRPSPQNVAACEQAFYQVNNPEALYAEEINTRLELIKMLV